MMRHRDRKDDFMIIYNTSGKVVSEEFISTDCITHVWLRQPDRCAVTIEYTNPAVNMSMSVTEEYKNCAHALERMCAIGRALNATGRPYTAYPLLRDEAYKDAKEYEDPQ